MERRLSSPGPRGCSFPLGLEAARPGFTAIRARGRVSSPNATSEQLEDLCRYVQDTSPVRDSLANAVPIETTLDLV